MYRTTFPTSFIALAMCFLILGSFPMPANAQDASSTPVMDDDRISRAFEFYPAETGWGTFFEVSVKAGTTVEMTALLANTGEIPQDLRTYAINAFTKVGGGFAAAEYGTAPNEVTSWLDFEEQVYTVEPGSGIERSFAIAVPEGTPPGQYITAIAGEHADASAVEGSDNFSQKLRYAVPVFVTVPGDTIAGFQASDVLVTTNDGSMVISVRLNNTGDVRIRPEGTVDIVGANSDLVASIPFTMDSIYARDETILTVGSSVQLEAGSYTVRFNLTDPETGATANAESNESLIDSAATPVPATILISSTSVSPAPSPDDVQFANVEAVITNGGDPVTNAQLSLIASVDGAEIERFPISQSLSLPTGDTPVTTRYIPATGWTSGAWTFELLLETVEPSGAAVVVGRQAIDATITIP